MFYSYTYATPNRATWVVIFFRGNSLILEAFLIPIVTYEKSWVLIIVLKGL